MEKIVYILGAGFSAPLGLPVMSNFLEKSKDQFAAHSDKYAHFKDIFEHELNQVHIPSSYYQTNVFNIEDILSILEFRARLDDSENGEQRLEGFLRYLKDVIIYYTPVAALKENPRNLLADGRWNRYIQFVAALMNCGFQSSRSPLVSGYEHLSHIFVDNQASNYQYSVITFNYDLVLESIQKHLEGLLSPRYFHRSIDLSDPQNQIAFAKLHGSIDSEIVPPTWNKTLNPNILCDWKVAYKALSEANQIRILGYSLPFTDAYFRFLLRAAIINTPNLRQIDVICKDDNGSVKKSYDEFVKYPKYRFVSAKIEDYLRKNEWDDSNGVLRFDLEKAHKTFLAEIR
ncbi:MAG TPA: hypothetical protein VHO69_07075 [Phototrophicaceae bacterium]|nr:hypothetical protein [Phototrophicaceae bacterium]